MPRPGELGLAMTTVAGAEANSAPALFGVGSAKPWSPVLCQLITPFEARLIFRGGREAGINPATTETLGGSPPDPEGAKATTADALEASPPDTDS